ncbi:hypothetical protein CVIRNUC_007551 [Coccomyxa viridis]|uniref:Uncharacterized protein n=1 Tax=Coccomyxa viridis TaxID=1274662 RepID=A0AAV1IDR3_9CHLO|nr:hypothetical protein CVIRNUC_007551 [Coccomyxa viridis]
MTMEGAEVIEYLFQDNEVYRVVCNQAHSRAARHAYDRMGRPAPSVLAVRGAFYTERSDRVPRPAPQLWLFIDKLRQDLPGARSAMLQKAGKQTLSTSECTALAVVWLRKPVQHCRRLCELRPAAIVKLLPFSG